MKEWRECERCSKIYAPARTEQRFCTLSCAREHEHQQRRDVPDLKDRIMLAVKIALDKALK